MQEDRLPVSIDCVSPMYCNCSFTALLRRKLCHTWPTERSLKDGTADSIQAFSSSGYSVITFLHLWHTPTNPKRFPLPKFITWSSLITFTRREGVDKTGGGGREVRWLGECESWGDRGMLIYSAPFCSMFGAMSWQDLGLRQTRPLLSMICKVYGQVCGIWSTRIQLIFVWGVSVKRRNRKFETL